jgi:sugar lactone lactonase YvrE
MKFHRTALFLLGLPIVLAVVFLLWPSPIQPVAWHPPKAPNLSDNLAVNQKLEAAEQLGLNHLNAAEDIAIDSQGTIFATDENRIAQLNPNNQSITTLVETKGQNLGLAWLNPKTLVVANQPLGLLLVDIHSKTIQPISNPTIHYANAVAVSADGSTVYFTDSSNRYYGEKWKYLYDLLEARPHGRLFAFDLKTGQFRQLLDQLYYPNGVALSPQENYLLVNETYRYRIRRFWLKGTKAGTSDIFADNLPGFPDGLSRDAQTGNYLAAMYTIRNPAIDWLHPHPWMKAQLAKLPRFIWPKPRHYGMVLVLNAQGQIIETLQDPQGKLFAISSARRIGSQLYIGTLHGGFVGRLNLKAAQLSAQQR